MAQRPDLAPSALGFSTHTGWAALIAISGPPSAPTILERRRVDMIAAHDPAAPAFVFHAARGLALDAAERSIRAAADRSQSAAKSALAAVLAQLRARRFT